jgi:uncharacterized OB-fold protein
MNIPQETSGFPPSRPIREGLFDLDPPRLRGSRCSACGTATFPIREFCAACNSDVLPEHVPLATDGTIYSYTVIHQAPAGRKTPYALAYVDLADGVRVLAQVDGAQEALHIGMPVSLRIGQVGAVDGTALIGYTFAPSGLAGEAA